MGAPSQKRRLKPRGIPFPKGNKLSAGRPRKPLEVRVIEIDVRRYSREYGREAVDKLIQLMRGVLPPDVSVPVKDGETPKPVIVGAATQLAAAEAILDRGYGRPPQAVEIAGKDGGPVVTENSAYDILVSRLNGIAERIREGEAPKRLN
jgi:hypothetical protein